MIIMINMIKLGLIFIVQWRTLKTSTPSGSSGYGGLHATLPHDLRQANGARYASPGWGGWTTQERNVLHTTNYCNICVHICIYLSIFDYWFILCYYIYIDIGLCRNQSKNDHVSLLCIIVWAAQTSVAIEDIICSRFIVARRKKTFWKIWKSEK